MHLLAYLLLTKKPKMKSCKETAHWKPCCIVPPVRWHHSHRHAERPPHLHEGLKKTFLRLWPSTLSINKQFFFFFRNSLKSFIWALSLKSYSLLFYLSTIKCSCGKSTLSFGRTCQQNVTEGVKYLTSLLFSSLTQCCGCSSLVVVRSIWKCSVSCLIAAAITSHCISLFYGHEQVWSSQSPYGVSLETSASILFTTSAPGLSPTVGGEYSIVNMLWLMRITSQISRERSEYGFQFRF